MYITDNKTIKKHYYLFIIQTKYFQMWSVTQGILGIAVYIFLTVNYTSICYFYF